MGIHFQRLMKKKTEQELRAYVDDAENFQKEAVIAAIDELKERNKADTATMELKNSIESKLKLKAEQTKKGKQEFIIPKGLPTTIRWAGHLVYLSFIVGIINSIVKVNMDLLNDLSSFSNIFSIMFTFGFMVFIGYSIHLGRKWARTLFMIIFMIGFSVLYYSLQQLLIENPIVGSITIMQAIIQFVALILLYHQKSVVWYKKIAQEEREKVDPESQAV